MALKAELEQWHQAVEYFDLQDYDSSLEIFRTIADSAKIHFNIGLILGRKGDHNAAIEAYSRALGLDQYLVVAYFQRGVARMVQQQNADALSDFNNALKYLRDNEFIDYTQIGLNYKVYTCEVIYNRALCFFCLGQEEDAQADLADASKHIVEERHSLIKRAIASNGMDCPLYCIPKGIIYRPSASKLQSTKKIDFLGSAKVIASADGKDNFTGFKGALVRKETLKNMGASAAIAHQKSMRVRRTTPPPDMMPTGGLARSNTMPVNRPADASPASQRPVAAAAAAESSSSMPPAAMRMRSVDNLSAARPGPPTASPSATAAPISAAITEPDSASSSSSAFSTPTPTPDAISAAPASPATPKSAMKKPAKNGAVDPLDIIRAGLARRTTLKNQQRQLQQGAPPQRSATLKQLTAARSPHTDSDSGSVDGDPGYDAEPPSRLAAQLRSNLAAGTNSRGPSPAPAAAMAQVARTEVIMPVIQRSSADFAIDTTPTDYSPANLSPEYYASEHPSAGPASGGSAGMQHPGMMHAQSVSNPVMMTPPLTHEELVARGIAAIGISQAGSAPQYHQPQPHYRHVQQHQQQQHSLGAYTSSSSVSLSPASPATGLGGHYGSLNGSTAAGSSVRRAPTRKDAMKVKVHYGNDIINLMVPKMAPFDTLRAKVAAKLISATASGQQQQQSPLSALRIQYLDEDGEAVLMTDEDDFELAKAYAGGDMSAPETNVVDRLELWCTM
ncbi:hypothetical protein LPJ61_001770 [Coemansia biformis]|uniref:PB1 domain-containing protein n=1 Tax=Coemansia biformis TaxID=1286918 RepID=A0A9W8CZS0_9FUNG|nr:hypothetical protein LPJ61_001770 [Coemansia biformis]